MPPWTLYAGYLGCHTGWPDEAIRRLAFQGRPIIHHTPMTCAYTTYYYYCASERCKDPDYGSRPRNTPNRPRFSQVERGADKA